MKEIYRSVKPFSKSIIKATDTVGTFHHGISLRYYNDLYWIYR